MESLICWVSRKQRSVTTPTTQAEYMALANAMTQIEYVRQLLSEFDIIQNTPVIIYEDNAGCINLAKKDELNDRSRHVDNKYHFVQEQVRRKRYTLEYIQTKEQTADILTKNLDVTSFRKFRNKLGVVDQP